MTITTLLFFAIFGVVAGLSEHSMREDNIAQGITTPLDHTGLLIYRIIVGVIWMGAVVLYLSMFDHLSWKTFLLIPLGAGAFGIFHRLTISMAAERGPFYLGVDSKYDRFFLGLGMDYVYPESQYHFEAWTESESYRLRVQACAVAVYIIELTAVLGSAYILLP